MSVLGWSIGGVLYLILGAATAALLSWRRPDQFTHRGQFFVSLAYVIALTWPFILTFLLIRLAIVPAQWLAQKRPDK